MSATRMNNNQNENTLSMEGLRARWNNWANLPEHADLIKNAINLDPFFEQYENEKDKISKQTLLRLMAYLDKVLTTIAKPNKTPEGVTCNLRASTITIRLNDDPFFLKEGAKIVRALDKGNSKRNRARKYLAGGIIATIFGLGIIAALGLLIAPAVPALAAAVPFLAMIAPIAHTILMYALISYGAINFIGAITIVGAPYTAALPLFPLIVGISSLIKSYDLFKPAPEGLALTLANAFPALLEKTHYGNKKETSRAKLEKAEGKLYAFQAMENKINKIESSGSAKDKPTENDIAFVNAGKTYYQERVNYLIAKGKKAKGNKPEKNSKEDFLAKKEHAGDDYKDQVSVKDHRNEDVNPRLRKALHNTLFSTSTSFHKKHATKVEEATREKRRVKAAR